MQLAVSPGFTSRPSLSGQDGGDLPGARPGVAGIHVPAFVERPSSQRRRPHVTCVAGIHVPAFVERSCRPTRAQVGPGVAGIHVPAFVERVSTSARARRPAVSVAGIHVPAFVERVS